MTNMRVGRWGVQPPWFNRGAADVVFKTLMALPDDETAAVYGRILVDATVQHDLVRHGDAIAKALDRQSLARSEAIRKRLRRTALVKSRAGQDAAEELRQIAVLIKALDFTTEERQHFVAQQQRDLHSGRFVREHHPIAFDKSVKGLSDAHATQYGIEPHATLSGEDRQRFQQAYLQVKKLTQGVRGMGDKALIHLHVHDKSGKETVSELNPPKHGEQLKIANHVPAGSHVHAVSISVTPPMTAGGAAYDALSALGAPNAAGAAYTTLTQGAGDPDTLRGFREAISETGDQDDYIPSQRVFRNIESGSKLLRESLGDAAPKQLQYAMRVGEHVGRFGPEAQQVIGPAADRAAYRYRGTERTIDSRLQTALANVKAGVGIPRSYLRDPENPSKADVAAAKREYLLHGKDDADGDWRGSPVLTYFKTKLPKPMLNSLHLASGVVPPSTGIIIDRNNAVTHEAVGYGDDHYLPFNLKHLAKLKGGEYIRTRTFGGPTTEDIYTGLMSGAKGLTVVSNNGVYTVDFAPDLKGGRRFNDKAARMVGRYGHILDAVRSGQVDTGGLDPSRNEELKAKVARLGYDEDDDPTAFGRELKKLQDKERKNPTLSETQRSQAALDFFNSEAFPQFNGEPVDADALRQAYVDRKAAGVLASYAEHNRANPGQHMTPPSMDVARAQAREEVDKERDLDKPYVLAQKVAEASGKGRAFETYMHGVEQTNRDSITPLALNGRGYDLSLQALQEQFPHYIARVAYHPWGVGESSDTGYVRPRHNRPAEALSGWFDERIGRHGTGKVLADSTRWQNRRQEPIPVKAKAKPEAGEQPGTKATESAADVADRKEDAAKAFGDALRNPATPVGAEVGRGLPGNAPSMWAGQTARDLRENDLLPQHAPRLHELLNMPDREWDDMVVTRPAERDRLLAGVSRELKDRDWLKVPRDVRDNYERQGAAPDRSTVKLERPVKALGLRDKEYAFGSPIYSPTSKAEPGPIEDTYGEEPTIQALVKAGDLPEALADATEDVTKAAGDRITAAHTALRAKRTRGIQVAQKEFDDLDRQAEGVLRARQLHRRHGEATERVNTAATRPPTAEDDDRPNLTQSIEYHVATDGRDPAAQAAYMLNLEREMAEQRGAEVLRRAGIDDGRTIDQ